ncbi:ATP-binding protein [Planomonospora corallina]|uniref:histidine kinase n=1 Tax=Planomonospora corallina TaxID=1806052 RepID=A0ABV8ICC0_9ACTN
MKWSDRSVAGTLRSAFVLLVSLVLLGGVVGAVESVRHSAALDRIVEHNAPVRVNNLKMTVEMNEAARGLSNHLLFGQSEEYYRQSRESARSLLEVLVARADTPEERRLTAELERRFLAWAAHADRAGEVDRDDRDETARYVREHQRLYEQVVAAAQDLETYLRGRSDTLVQESERQRLLALAGTAAFALVAIALALFASVRTYRVLVPPLDAMRGTLDRLAAGDHEARAPATGGPVEIRRLGSAINMLADESERLRRAERERVRLAEVVYETAGRIRQTLDVDDIVREAASLLGARLPADQVFIQLVRDGEIGPAELQWSDGGLVEAGTTALLPAPSEQAERLYAESAASSGSTVDPPGHVPEAAARALRALGDTQYLFAPFGTGGELLGAILVTRDSRGPWGTEEIEAVKSVGTDLGRALHQARLYGRERELVEELRALDAAKTDFMSAVSHELRTPLTSISGYLEILCDEEAGELNPVQEQMLQAIDRNTTRLRLLIEDLLTLSRIESGSFRTVKQETDLCAVTRESVASVRKAAEEGRVALEVACRPERLLVDGDPNQLDRALVNLLANAVKFTPAGGRVDVTVTLEEGHAVLRVADTGIGIPADELQRMETRFFRASNATERSIPGTGLGLSIVRSIVANHSGTFDLRSREGEGTTVTVRIPTCATKLRTEGDETGAPAGAPREPGPAPGRQEADHRGH